MFNVRMLVCLMASLSLVSCSGLPEFEQFQEVDTKAEALRKFGDPVSTWTRVVWSEEDKWVFGPIESFISTTSVGDSITVWVYAAEGGEAELYFLGASHSVRGIAFGPEGVIY